MMKKIKMDRLHGNVEQKYRAKMYKSGKKWVIKGLLFSSLLLGGAVVFNSESVEASGWQANSVETIQAKLKEGQNSYTFEEGDTFYNIGLAVNVKWQTLMELNGFKEGSQYTVPVGTTIKFDGSKVTVIDKNGNAINEKNLTEADKIDPSKTFADQKSDLPKTTAATNTAPTQTQKKPNTANTNGTIIGNNSTSSASSGEKPNQVERPVDKAQAEKEKQEAEKAREQAEKAKQEAEKARQEAEKLKQEAEKKLTEALNTENSHSLTDIKAKQAAAKDKIADAQAAYNDLSAQLATVIQKITAATTAKQVAQSVLTEAQTAINAATTNHSNAQQRVNEVNDQITALQGQAGENESIQMQLTQLKQQLGAAQTELETYNHQLITSQQALNSAQTAYNTAEVALATAVTEKASIDASVTQAQNTLAAAQQELANLPNAEVASTSDQAKKIQAEIAQYNDRIAVLDKEIDVLTSKIQSLTDRITELDQVIQGVAVDIDEVERDGNAAGASAADDNKHVEKSKETADEVEKNLPHIPVNEDKHVTIMVDEEGNTITDVTGYVKLSESQPIKTVETLENGDTITMYTTTVTYHKVVNTDKHVTINVDEEGNTITDTTGYTKVSESQPEKIVETLENGDTITTYTTTVIYHKVINTEKHVTINVDEEGNSLATLDGYVKIDESEAVKEVKTLANGDTITTYTITVTYHKIVNTEKHITINVDEEGQTLTSLDGYSKVKESSAIKTEETLENGDTITVYTTTVTYHKIVNTDKEVTINVDEEGNVLTNLDGYFKIAESEPVKTIKTLANGDTETTYTTTVTYHKIVNTDKEVTINVDEEGNTITSTTGYFKIKTSDPVKTVKTLANGDTETTYTTTITYHKIQNTEKHVTKNVDQLGNELSDLNGYEKVSTSQPVITVETLSNGDTITTYTTTVTYKKTVGKDPIIEAIKPKDDPEIKAIEEQVTNGDTMVTVEQADKLVNADFSKLVAKYFEGLVQQEQRNYNEQVIVSNTKDDAAYREVAERAIEVMYYFDHDRPSNKASTGTYEIEREKGSQEMSFWSENISYASIMKYEVNGDSEILAQLIANKMFDQYIDSEREAGRAGDYSKGGHYMNIIMSGHTDMALAVFIVDSSTYAYKFSTTVVTGYSSTVK